MAGIKEIALGIASVLPSDFTPDPLYVDLWNEPPEAGAAIAKAVIDECVDGDIPISKVVVDPAMWEVLAPEAGERYRGVQIAMDEGLEARIEFHRS